MRNCDGELKCEVTRLAAYHEHRLNLGSKAIFHIEAFIAASMALYKKFLEESMSAMFWNVKISRHQMHDKSEEQQLKQQPTILLQQVSLYQQMYDQPCCDSGEN